MKISGWKFTTGLAVILIIVFAIAQYGSNRQNNPDGGVTKYKEYEIMRSDFRISVTASGVVNPIDRIEIKSKASGRIEYLPVEEGDFIKKDELICRLDKTDVQAEVDQTQADLDIAEAELTQTENDFSRQKELFDKHLISRQELDRVELSLAQAKGKLVRTRIARNQAEVRLSETIVRAPIDGVILKKFVEAGQIISSGINNVSGGTPIVAVADMNHVYITAGIDEIDVGKIQINQEANVTAEAYPFKKFRGSIIRMSPEARIEQNVTLFDVIIEVENTDGMLKSGMNASVEITIVEQDDVLIAPMMALMISDPAGINRSLRNALVKENGEFVSREIEIGLYDFKQAIVISGLKQGDILGVPMDSRLKAENDRMEQRIRSTRGFGTSDSNSTSGRR
ncbi:MAG: efflux RND transporter periplasmic adaptor subunit [Candidatus Zixiibacteriota bacterium]